ncbi:MAG TPA: (2Fe-2S)-binding protein, partial [Marinobacter adhaerens]|nr:(2Fe-2S)-binding protein [Marinobacter adhaerens]
MATLTINGERYELDVPDDMPLLWVIRDVVGLKGTKFGCGMSQCGACTVHLNGTAIRSCVTPVSAASGEITTIEAMADDPVGSKVQQAWLDLGVAQCGYCQGGQIMNATALLKRTPNPETGEIV